MYDVIVIGAAVAGCRTAELVAKKGFKVLLVDQKKHIGVPCKCTGLVSWRIKEILPDIPDNVVTSVGINAAKFFSPNGRCLTLQSKKPVYLLDRSAFDKYLHKRAKKSGVDVRMSERFEGFEYGKGFVVVKTDKGKMLVGADGANSIVREAAGLKAPGEIFIGAQVTAGGGFDQSSVELWFGNKISPNFFAWVVPENRNTARIGLAVKRDTKNYYDKFMKKRIGKSVKPDTGGIIRVGLMEDTVADRVMLVGDAACQVKPFSGGGITYGLLASEIAADACAKALRQGRFDYNFLDKNYDNVWKRKLARPIKKGMMYRKMIYAFPDVWIDTAFMFANLFRPVIERFDFDLL
jgi:digeranylgeranylglycerophospholipid reductase